MGFQCFYNVLAPCHERPHHLFRDSEVFPYLYNNILKSKASADAGVWKLFGEDGRGPGRQAQHPLGWG